jgi:hypothetical protein
LGVWLVVLLGLVYLGTTAYLGYRVGTAISQAKTHALIAIGAGIVGRNKVERVAIQKSGLPNYLTASPAFWLALRVCE